MTEDRGSDSTLNKLHRLVSEELVKRLEAGDETLTTADIRAAIEWLNKNNWTSPASTNPALQKLSAAVMEIDVERIRAISNGPTYN